MNVLKQIQKNFTIFLAGIATGTLITLVNKWLSVVLLLIVAFILFGWPLLRARMKKARESEG